MKLYEIKNPNSSVTYAGLRFTKDTIKSFNDLAENFKIPNKLPNNEYHSTLLFSRKKLPDYEPIGKLKMLLTGEVNKCAIWPTQSDNPKNCLVLLFKCEELSARHNWLMKKHKASWDFPEYIPHVTLSYDVGEDFDLSEINKYLKDNEVTVEMDEEYSEKLNLSEGC